MPRMPDTRLLFASRLAYLVPPPGGPAPVPPATYDLHDIETWSAGPDSIDAALLARAPEGLILAFRGTLPITSPDTPQAILDWLNDANALLVRDPDLPGRVHQGFRDSLTHLWHHFIDRLLERVRAAPGTPLYVTGHSKGGAVAFLAGMKCRQALQGASLGNAVHVRTFAAARPGDQGFADGFDAAFPDTLRYEYADDIVPHLPPSLMFVRMLQKLPQFSAIPIPDSGFVSAGTLQYFDRGSTDTTPPKAETPLLELERMLAIARQIVALNFRAVVGDHSIGTGSGYADAVTGGP